MVMPRDRSIRSRRHQKTTSLRPAGRLMNPFVALQRTFTCLARPALSTQFNNPESADLVVRVAGQRWHVHRLVLSSGSAVFAAMLAGDWSERGHRELNLGDDCHAAHFGAFLRFFYTGELHMTAHSLPSFYFLADKYFVRPLLDNCARHLLRGLRLHVHNAARFDGHSSDDAAEEDSSASSSSSAGERALHRVTASELFPLSNVAAFVQNCSVPEIARAARLNLLLRLAQEVSQLNFGSFAALPHDLLLSLCADDGFVAGEYQLFQAIGTWFRERELDAGAEAIELRRQAALALYRQVRFALMSLEELYDCDTEVCRTPGGSDVGPELVLLLREALRFAAFRACPRARAKECAVWSGALFRPRRFSLKEQQQQKSARLDSNHAAPSSELLSVRCRSLPSSSSIGGASFSD